MIPGLSLIFQVGGEMKKVAGGQTCSGVTVNKKRWGRGIKLLGNNTKFSKYIFILMQLLHGVN